MRAGVATTVISSSGQLNTGVVESDDIQNATIVNADISATAAIAYTKLTLTNSIIDADVKSNAAIASTKIDLSSVSQDIIPDVNASRYCGTGAKAWLYGYFSLADVGNFLNSIDPNVTATQHIGTAARTWAEIYVNDIQGTARGMIMSFGLLGV
jgi:VCBS repeat-containing protein